MRIEKRDWRRKKKKEKPMKKINNFRFLQLMKGNRSRSPKRLQLSISELKAQEVANAQAECGFNPYAATFSSSTQANSIMRSVSTGTNPGEAPGVRPPGGVFPPGAPIGLTIPPSHMVETENEAIYVLLCQEPSSAMSAAEILAKVLTNILNTPTVRHLSNEFIPEGLFLMSLSSK